MQFAPISLSQIKEQLAQLQAYELAQPETLSVSPAALGTRRSALPMTAPGTPVATPDAAIVANGVVSFVSGMSEQNKADVRNSYLYAGLVATKAFPQDKDGAAWYDKFAEVMNALGWAFTARNYSRYSARDQSLSMDQVGLQIIGSLVASAAVPVGLGPALLKAAGSALDGLKQASNSEPLKLFSTSANKTESGQFTLGSCVEDDEGEVIMVFGAFHCRTSENRGNLLFVRWNSASTQVYTGSAQMALNPMVYAMARPLVLEALGINVVKAIASYEI